MGCFVDDLIQRCVDAGVVFRPRHGQLRPMLTKGRPPDTLLEDVKANRELILRRLAELMEFDGLTSHPPLPEDAAGAPGADPVDTWRKKHETGKTDNK
ncbi:MAG TPA: hypothetical protein P5026_10720 [Kiritimatiellia bacterium]|nr:hypothetical protein [Kiritimatiellia bacterium]HRU71397.1 hypothetical protein [Kiritimatiellia bacterium]